MPKANEIFPNDRESLVKGAFSRRMLYLLLARIFAAEADRPLLAELGRPEIRGVLKELDIETGLADNSGRRGDIIEALGEEFTFLFLGPGKHVAPYESVQLKQGSGLLMGKETVFVSQFIDQAGFDFTPAYGGIPDHISVELEFLGRLAEAEAWALEDNDTERCLAAAGWQHEFISRHIGKWASVFAKRVKERATLPFYPGFARILPRFLATERAHLAAVLDKAPQAAVNQ